MSSILKVDTIQDQSGNNIINENADTITIGASGDTITIPAGATLSSTDPLVFPAGTVSAPAITTTGDTNTGIFFSAADTIDFAEGGVATGQFDSSGNFKFNSGYGSVATAYGCRAWVNFNGTGTVAIRDSGNVSSITDNGAGDYTINFTNALPDANYAISGVVSDENSISGSYPTWTNPRGPNGIMTIEGVTPQTSSLVRIATSRGSTSTSDGDFQDEAQVQIMVIR